MKNLSRKLAKEGVKSELRGLIPINWTRKFQNPESIKATGKL
jgi:hypothetical protein